MLSNVSSVSLRVAVIMSVLMLSGAGALAATVLPPPDSAFAQGRGFEVTVIEIMKKKQDPNTIWNPEHDGERCMYRIRHCRHFHRDYYYEIPWWGLPWASGGEAVALEFMHDGKPILP